MGEVMPRILVLTDRPRTDDLIFTWAVDLAHRLDVREVSAVVTCAGDTAVVAGSSMSIPDGGALSPDASSMWLLSLGRGDVTGDRQFFARCRHEAAFYGLSCETARSVDSLKRTAAMLGDVVNLIVINRETLLNDEFKNFSMGHLWPEISCPCLIYPTTADSWKRIVIAHRNDLSEVAIVTWAMHWSEVLGIPVSSIQLAQPSRSVGAAINRWLPWNSLEQRREQIRDGMRDFGLGSSDLLLVNRQTSVLPVDVNGCEMTLDDVVAAAPCTVGIVPSSPSAVGNELLFPHRITHVSETEMGIEIA